MPHLTTPTVPRPAGDTAGGLRFGAPGYGHPMLAPLEWDELSRPGTPLRWAVLNVRHGPGERPDGYCREAVSRVRSAGRSVLGRLECHRGFRPFRELLSDAHRFLEWYGVDGFYLARCPGEPACLDETRRVTTTLRALCPDGLLVLGHGHCPHQGYADCADQLVTFAGSWAEYRWSQAAYWTAGLRRNGSVTSSTRCRALISTRHCGSPAGRARARCDSPTAPIGPARTRGRDCPVTGTKSSRASDTGSGNERARGSVTRTSVAACTHWPEPGRSP